jgi:hypothetical protein
MNAELRGMDWDSMLSGDINEDWCRFRDMLKDMESRYVPRRILKINKHKKNNLDDEKSRKKS